jgi:hypothetical protein
MNTRKTPTTTGGAIHVQPWTRGNRLVGYDLELKRLWVGGQRLHHGATGIALAAAGLARLSRSRRALAWTLAGSALVAHDWKDRSLWFAGGPQPD